jgi:single-strand DNA-binding protein
MLNLVVLQGRLVRDPELKKTNGGASVVSGTLAVDRDYQPGGEKKCDFVDFTAWRQTAEFISKWFCKGNLVMVKGELHSRKWQDRDGNNRMNWEVEVDETWFCGDRAKESSAVNVEPPTFEELGEGESSDLPF